MSGHIGPAMSQIMDDIASRIGEKYNLTLNSMSAGTPYSWPCAAFSPHKLDRRNSQFVDDESKKIDVHSIGIDNLDISFAGFVNKKRPNFLKFKYFFVTVVVIWASTT